jgi:sugar/nucleoside kinase (ribokinase family)
MSGNRLPFPVVVGGHICLDVIPTLFDRQTGMEALLVPGKLIDIGPAVLATGGAVSNTGLALHRLGMPVRMMGKVGDDRFGDAIIDLISSEGIKLADEMIVAKGETSSYTIVI